MATVSMTGFGSAKRQVDQVEILVEMRSVNHRHLDISVKMPFIYSSQELMLQRIIKEELRRGHVDLFVSRKLGEGQERPFVFRKDIFDKYYNEMQQAQKAAGLKSTEASVAIFEAVISRREVFEASGEDTSDEKGSEQEFQALESAVRESLKQLKLHRNQEGAALETEVLGHFKEFENLVTSVSKLAPDTVKTYRERLTQRLAKLEAGGEVSADRLAQEVALLADRVDITEELARLDSHAKHFRQFIKAGEGGRKLDFLIQELGREINTVGSKAQNGEIALKVVEAKAVLEKIREQVQNIE